MIVGYVKKKLVMRQIRALGGRAGRRVLRKATNASGNPVAKRLRQLIPRRTANGSGTLKRNIRKRVVSETSEGRVECHVGARKKQPGLPSRYFHLVDKGAKAHKISPKTVRRKGRLRQRLSFWDGSRLQVRPSVQHPGLIGKQYVWRARLQSKKAAVNAFVKKAKEEISKEIAKARAGANKSDG